MATKAEVMAGMDVAAELAAKELEKLDPQVVRQVADWWKFHYLTAGHKRLGRVLLTKATSIATELAELVKEE